MHQDAMMASTPINAAKITNNLELILREKDSKALVESLMGYYQSLMIS